MFDRILDTVFKRDDPLFLEHGSHTFNTTIRNHLNKELLPEFIDYVQMLSNAKGILEGKETAEPAHITLLDSLVFQNPFGDDIEKNSEIVSDLVSSITKLGTVAKKVKKAKNAARKPLPQTVP